MGDTVVSGTRVVVKDFAGSEVEVGFSLFPVYGVDAVDVGEVVFVEDVIEVIVQRFYGIFNLSKSCMIERKSSF